MHRLFITLLIGLSTVTFGSWMPAHASADSEVTLRVSGITVVGAVDNRLWAATLSLLGCTWRSLGASPMTDNYVIHGTDGEDTIRVVQAPLFWCNRLVLPANQNGRSIQVYGGEGNDVIYGGGSAPFSGNPNWIFGEEGDDTLYLGSGGARGEGGPGDDTIYGGDSAGDVMIGGDGEDALCEQSATVALTLDGGDGTDDTSCSETATSGFTGIESTNCARCGFSY
jgi:Ca2+-binding RTX toxin-like protein